MQMEQIRSSGMFSGWRAIGGAVSDVMVVCVEEEDPRNVYHTYPIP